MRYLKCLFISLFFLLCFSINNTRYTNEINDLYKGGYPSQEQEQQGICITPCYVIDPKYYNIQVSQDPNCYTQVEVSIDINPKNPNNIVVTWIDYRSTGNPKIGYAYSFDGGLTWNENILPLIDNWPLNGDPVVSSDTNGFFYILYIAYLQNVSDGGLYLVKSTDGGITWPESLRKRIDDSTINTFEDKGWIIIDKNSMSATNNIYIFWTRNSRNILFTRSTNGGQTFDPIVTVSDISRNGQYGVSPAIGKNGEIYAIWMMQADDPIMGKIFVFDKSLNFGLTFNNDQFIDTIGNYKDCEIKALDRILPFPYLASNPLNGDLYLTWNRPIHIEGLQYDSSDILFRYSNDQGSHWSDPVNIITNGSKTSQTLNDQFFPSICVNPSGSRISIGYYDRSDFPNNDSMYLKVSTSIDGGKTFTLPVQISYCPTIPYRPAPSIQSFFGDYITMASSNDLSSLSKVYPIWVDSRNGNHDIFISPADVQIRLKDTISNNSTLSGRILIEDNVTISSGVTLFIIPGTEITFKNGYSLTINGKLIAKGDINNRIAFTSSNPTPQPGDWEGIICSGGGPDTLTYCDIKYATNGIRFVNTAANSYMFNDTISRTSECGVFVSNTNWSNPSLKIYKCVVSNNDKSAVKVNNARVLISHSKMENNEQQQLGPSTVYVCNGGRVYIDSTRIQNNVYLGVEASGTSSRAILSIDEYKKGYNTLNQNGGGEVYVHNSARAILGFSARISYCSCPDQTAVPNSSVPGCPPGCTLKYRYEPRAGYNNVYDSYTFPGRLVNNTSDTTVPARYIYWGTHRASEYIGSVDTLYQLSSAVNTPSKTMYLEPPSEIMALGEEWQILLEWVLQLKKDVEENRENAIDALYQLALHVGEGGAFESAFPLSWEMFLRVVENSSLPDRIRSTAYALRTQLKIDKGEYQTAIGMANDMLSRRSIGDDLWLYHQTRKIFASVGSGDSVSAWSIFNAVKPRGYMIDSTAIKTMEEYLVTALVSNPGFVGSGTEFRSNSISDNELKPKTYKLEQNYPNPFNPITVINYQLPVDGLVTLKVFNILGQEIVTLVDESASGGQEAGYKSVSYDASQLPSGVYFYKLSVAASKVSVFTDVKKMIVIK